MSGSFWPGSGHLWSAATGQKLAVLLTLMRAEGIYAIGANSVWASRANTSFDQKLISPKRP